MLSTNTRLHSTSYDFTKCTEYVTTSWVDINVWFRIILVIHVLIYFFRIGRYQDLDNMGDFEDLVRKYNGGKQIPPEKINLLRLILTWTSEGNVIKQKKKAPVPLHSCNTVTFGQELTEKHLIPLFPKSGSLIYLNIYIYCFFYFLLLLHGLFCF